MLHKKLNSEQLLAQLEGVDEFKTASSSAQNELKDGNLINENMPKFKINDEGMEDATAYNIIHNELELDGRPHLNLASFVGTALDPMGEKLAVENITKNLADVSEYPALINIQNRCINIISHLWNVPQGCKSVGTATTGSSEAVQLGGLALKRRWEDRQKAKGKPTDKPNIVMGANAQVALEKFARYFDVEGRLVPVSKSSRYCLDLSKLEEYLDENTIGVYVIMGSTYTGHYEDVTKVSELLDKYEKSTGISIPIHIDGASGGFVAPFLHPSMPWDFRCPRVQSINVSGHKFGLCTAGVGWVIWKDQQYLPQSLVFKLSYLGGVEESFTLNFSRPGHQVIQQYYNLVRLGRKGYAKLHGQSLANARLMSRFLEELGDDDIGFFEVVSDIHRPNGDLGSTKNPAGADLIRCDKHERFNFGLPVVAFKFSDEFAKKYPEIPQSAMSSLLKQRGYIIPNYPLPPNEESNEVLRVVVRSSMPTDMLDKLLEDISRVTNLLVSAAQKHRSQMKDTTGDAVSKARDMLLLITAPEDGYIEHEQSWEGDAFHITKPRHSVC